MFDDVLQAQSAVGRFINAAYDLVVEGESYRPNLNPQVDDQDPPPDTPVSKPRTVGRSRSRRKRRTR